jgi:hypothetical protein
MYEANGPRYPFNLNNNMYTSAVFYDIEKAFDTTWHSGLLYKLSKLEFSTSLIKLINSIHSQCKFTVSVEGEMSTPSVSQTMVRGSQVVLEVCSCGPSKKTEDKVASRFCPAPNLHNICIYYAPRTPAVYVAIFVDDTCLYATNRKKGFGCQ